MLDHLILRQTQFAIGTPEEEAATPTQAGTAGTELSQVSLQKGMLVELADIGAALVSGVVVTASQTDDAVFTVGTSKTQPVAGTYRSVRDAVDDGDAGTLAMNAKRGVYVTLEAADSTPIALGTGGQSAATLRTVTATDSPEIPLLTTIDSKLADLKGYTDGLEALATTLNGYVDGLETLVGTTNTTLTTLNGYVDTLEAKATGPTTGTASSVVGSASDVTVLAANANRKGATVFNDSAARLCLLLANATSSTTVHTTQLSPYDYYEVPFGYTGIIKGIWDSATGNARVTELT